MQLNCTNIFYHLHQGIQDLKIVYHETKWGYRLVCVFVGVLTVVSILKHLIAKIDAVYWKKKPEAVPLLLDQSLLQTFQKMGIFTIRDLSQKLQMRPDVFGKMGIVTVKDLEILPAFKMLQNFYQEIDQISEKIEEDLKNAEEEVEKALKEVERGVLQKMNCTRWAIDRCINDLLEDPKIPCQEELVELKNKPRKTSEEFKKLLQNIKNIADKKYVQLLVFKRDKEKLQHQFPTFQRRLENPDPLLFAELQCHALKEYIHQTDGQKAWQRIREMEISSLSALRGSELVENFLQLSDLFPNIQ